MNPRERSLKTQSISLFVFLIAQYVLGMYANLFVQFPDNGQGGEAWLFAWQTPIVAAHIVVGILLALGAIGFLVRAFRSGSRAWKTSALLGLIGVLGAGVSGAVFIPSQTDAFSYSMSLFFLLAFFAYGWAFLLSRKAASVSET